jgi:hypothetical protein
MPLTAAEHQKISALQQIANLVGQASRVAGNPAVLNNVINNTLPMILQWERSDPEMGELARWLRRARVDKSPHVFSNIMGQVQRMLALVRTGLPYRTDPQYGLRTQWDPIRGHVSSPLFDKDEPVRTYSHMGWRGSKKFPFGLPFPQKNVIEGWGDGFGEIHRLLSQPTSGFSSYGDMVRAGAAIMTGGASEMMPSSGTAPAKTATTTTPPSTTEPSPPPKAEPRPPGHKPSPLPTFDLSKGIEKTAAPAPPGMSKTGKAIVVSGIIGFMLLFGGALAFALQE